MNKVTNFSEKFVAMNRESKQANEKGWEQVRIPVYQKSLLTLEEAAEYTGIGVNKLRSISNEEGCTFVLWNGTKRMFKRKKLDAYLEEAYSI